MFTADKHSVRFTKELYFTTSTVVDWVDVFTRPRYKQIIIEALKYCQQSKGLEIYGWVLMPNHLHMIVGTGGRYGVSDILRDFKKFTSKKIVSELLLDAGESRREWMLERFRVAPDDDKETMNWRFWQKGNYMETVATEDFFRQKLNYIHLNPVRAEFVVSPDEYMYSLAVDYAGGKGLLDVIVLR